MHDFMEKQIPQFINMDKIESFIKTFYPQDEYQ